MTTALNINKETKVEGNGTLAFYCSTQLSDEEQIIIEVEEYEYQDINGSYKRVKTGAIHKYRLESLYYNRGHYGERGVELASLTIRGFRKDKHLRYRTEMLYGIDLTKEVLDQIPDKYHNYARELFVKEMALLQDELTKLTNKGVKSGG
jgi:hypothetical protein